MLLSRSGYLQIKSATVGSMHLSEAVVRKPSQLTAEGLKQAKKRLKWYAKRDADKIKTDMARNDFETMIYKMRDWLREEENAVYVEAASLEAWTTNLTEMEDWLYEDGADANFTVYEGKHKDLSKEFEKLDNRKGWYEQQAEFKQATIEALDTYLEKIAKLSETKPWITNDELKDVTDKVEEIRTWFDALIEKQEAAPKHADPLVKASEVMGKIEKLKKLYTKVSKKKKPKPPKEEKPKEEEKEDFADGEGEAAKDAKDSEQTTEKEAPKEEKDERTSDDGKDKESPEQEQADL